MRLIRVLGPVAGYGVVCALCVLPLLWVNLVRVDGGSMNPALAGGDVAVVARNQRPRVGAIALLKVPGHGPVLHRIVSHRRDGLLVTKGDANERSDVQAVDPKYSAGNVVAVVHVGKLMQRWRATRTSDKLTAQPNSAGL